jgi:hypothetical protein
MVSSFKDFDKFINKKSQTNVMYRRRLKHTPRVAPIVPNRSTDEDFNLLRTFRGSLYSRGAGSSHLRLRLVQILNLTCSLPECLFSGDTIKRLSGEIFRVVFCPE